MREIMKLQQVSYEIEDTVIFEEVNASVHQKERIGIIGKNGAGKSTLLELIVGKLAASKGQIKWMADRLEIAYVEQEAESHDVDQIESAETVLLKKWHVPGLAYTSLSGGEKLKVRLSAGMAKGAHLLLLDEPTNHLDQPGIEFLLEQLKHYPGIVIFVSHNRAFLDAAATKIWSLENKKLIEHVGNYTSYMEERKQRRAAQQRDYEKQQKMVERIEGHMEELKSWSHKAHAESTKQEGAKEYYRKKAKRMDKQVKSKQKRLEKELEKHQAAPPEAEYEVTFSVKANEKMGRRFLEAKNLSKAFGSRILFEKANFTVQHGEKISIEGPNGSGKTTLLKIIMGEEETEGEIWLSPSADIGYLTQEVFDLPLEKTPEELFYKETFAARGKVQNLMKHLGFTAAQWTEPIGLMSMGERIKCKLMVYILEEKDVLILDEPTNHLDLQSREQLETTLVEYPGTMLVVSHDKTFIEETTSAKLVIKDGGIHKQLEQMAPEQEAIDELRLKLETERQAVLGKLSFMTPNDKEYALLDGRFNELTREIKSL